MKETLEYGIIKALYNKYPDIILSPSSTCVYVIDGNSGDVMFSLSGNLVTVNKVIPRYPTEDIILWLVRRRLIRINPETDILMVWDSLLNEVHTELNRKPVEEKDLTPIREPAILIPVGKTIH